MTTNELMRTIYDNHGRALERYVTKLLEGDRHAAADIVQETAVRAWQNASGLDVSGPTFRRWLLKVARRQVIDRHRKRLNRPVEVGGDVPDWAVRVSDSSERTMAAMVVSDVFSGLSTDHREVIAELYFRGASVADAAGALGVPAGTVKSRKYYALRAMRSALADRGLTSPM
ncbi:DNA-directed RNA polymerase sigma-70 factor [Lentzea sp. NBRC 105346]|uniref:sigma-70 family RNA polymerase sigma factor n=1 Tax=Lentzea sp. NBRC 105346 TaxID=3032205 RepID=UPI0024A478CB|nr:sigma-70 family RNA polymerase sigma factor [Lentzea sp. NBRC 105346]GLZ34995.1 DNA-directed RNA polymerase sigma-70 factor [Lentzea sp. NBRC 105346]